MSLFLRLCYHYISTKHSYFDWPCHAGHLSLETGRYYTELPLHMLDPERNNVCTICFILKVGTSTWVYQIVLRTSQVAPKPFTNQCPFPSTKNNIWSNLPTKCHNRLYRHQNMISGNLCEIRTQIKNKYNDFEHYIH